MTKCMHSNIDFILTEPTLRNKLLHVYEAFMLYEFAPLHFGRRSAQIVDENKDFNWQVIQSN